jgi:hypothetical protein
MSRFLALLMIAILVIAHGSSVAASVCRHQNIVEHAAALRSSDAKVSAVAFGEEAAGKVASKKAPADGGSISWPSGMVPSPDLPMPFRVSEPLEQAPPDAAALRSASIRPLLEPPAV